MTSPAEVAKANGLANAEDIVRAASDAGIHLAAGLAMMTKESGGRNVWGSDVGGTFSGKKGDVTEKDFVEFERRVANGERSNGVSVAQITYPGYFPQARKQGFRLWLPYDNALFGFRILKANYDKRKNWAEAGTLYNKGNLSTGVNDYGRTFAALVTTWEKRLKGANADPAPVPGGNDMSNPMTADQQIAQFRKFGLRIVERSGWRTHNRAGHGAYGPLNGVVVHHTGSDSSASSMEKYLYDGDDGRALPGPLCQWSIRTDGTVVMIANGRSNHAGSGSSTTLNHVINEDYDAAKTLKPGSDNTDGNAQFYGVETQYSGSHAPVKAQRDAMVNLSAAVCDFHGWTAKSVIGHKEWTGRKSDPGGVDMGTFRADISALLKSDPPPEPAPPKPDPTPPKNAKLDPDVKPGATHPQVADLQRLLIKAGYGPIKGAVTNTYGRATQDAVARFHQKNPRYRSRIVDPAIGPTGWAELQRQAAKK